MVTRFCNFVFPIFAKKHTLRFAMATPITWQVFTFFVANLIDSEHQIRYFERFVHVEIPY